MNKILIDRKHIEDSIEYLKSLSTYKNNGCDEKLDALRLAEELEKILEKDENA
jgi:hypothetical protein